VGSWALKGLRRNVAICSHPQPVTTHNLFSTEDNLDVSSAVFLESQPALYWSRCSGGCGGQLVSLKFIDLFAGLGGFHLALRQFGFECVFASEIDDELRELYTQNFPETASVTYGDIREHKSKVPPHNILCAGFPCQPFSKSGSQQGVMDRTRGTLFREILDILKEHEPEFVILENVGNFERHDKGLTWKIVKESLRELGYDVQGTEHIKSRGSGLLSPHHFGYPHLRERFFIVARKDKLPMPPFPQTNRLCTTSLTLIVQPSSELTRKEQTETQLSEKQLSCIEHWNEFLQCLPTDCSLPSFPIWGDELDATYAFERSTPYRSNIRMLRAWLNGQATDPNLTKDQLLELFPSYARTLTTKFPKWKIRFIKQNREWFQQHRAHISNDWIAKLREYPSSLRKLEWNCKGEERDIWRYVLQFRPSGLRVKRYSSSPALVAMTTTQIPILGPERRFITRTEGLKLQGFTVDHKLPKTYEAAFRALGNAVHVGVVAEIVKTLIISQQAIDKTNGTNGTIGTIDDTVEAENTHLFLRDLCEVSSS
jgi:DNA (cytosine-5)-methyltransferase 1